jgi:small conductance mechanosensitive channel
MRDFDAVLKILVDYLSACDSLSIDVGDHREKIIDRIVDSAANRSAFLDISVRRQQNLRATAAILSSNTEVTDRLSAASARVQLTAQSMNRLIAILGALGQEARHYRQQVITTTGAITTDVLKIDVVSDLFNQWFQSVRQNLISDGPRLLFRLLLMTLIIFIFVRLSRMVEKVIKRGFESSHITLSHLLQRMIVMTGRNLTILIGILIALSQVGISLGPLLTGLGIAGFIVGFAMQDALSNFASGMLILFYRPFDVGDTVEAGGETGKVHSMSLVNTTILTFDNQRLIIPNNKIWSSVIKNFTAQRVRRVDLSFGIAYHDDVDKAEEIFREIVDAHELTLDTPLPLIHLNELGESSVNFIVRPWVKTDDYWQVYWDITKEVKKRLDDAGMTIPFPQREIHIGQTIPDLPGEK